MLSPEERKTMLEEAADTRRRAALRTARLLLYGRLSPADFLTFLTRASGMLNRPSPLRRRRFPPGTYRL
jgi:hypothetical protein